MNNLEWNDAQIQALKGHWAAGLSSAEIARRLGTTKNAVVGKVNRLALPGRPSPIVRGGPIRPRVVRPAPMGKVSLPGGVSLAAVVDVAPVPVREMTGRCCWPLGTPKTKEFRYCDAPCDVKFPYCATHRALGSARATDQRYGVVEERPGVVAR